MNKKTLLKEIGLFDSTFTEEIKFKHQVIDFLNQHDDFYQRTNLQGQVTGSAWIISPNCKQVLLIHHKKLNIWVQPGGHADATDTSLFETAQREAIEECCVKIIDSKTEIFDLDIHEIPTKNDIPKHLHYDFRYCFVAEPSSKLDIDKTEINDAQWIDVAQLASENTSQSIRRMALKTIGTNWAFKRS